MEMLPVVAALALASGVYSSSNPCTLQLASGPCRASIQRYGYDTAKGKCVEFTYGGCEGNKNNFLTMENCEKECMGKGPKLGMSEKVPVPDRVKRSLFPLQTTTRANPFQAAIDAAASIKEKFGNTVNKVMNKFGKKKKIKKIPLPPGANFENFAWTNYRDILKKAILDPCMHPIEYGSGKKVNQRFYFDKKQKKCIHFQYRRKSKRHPYPLHTNNFEFISDCIRTCVEGKHREPDLKAILAANGIYYQ
ncbi:Kunitz/Bovine pancreatic trypsin inhibitor domain protein [Ancylostoma caninum]|uniref:Kunitz/Bovine pancreatic trypsin inhibitor domain protein n=1 Tax=Ancylostoma caninum TaxID=29170 RepID=A0A368FU21_ANCCA|nr:Kunitz/Bovine pancreatic trypsin inhibitor domain protein [Ancylostoma caninum]